MVTLSGNVQLPCSKYYVPFGNDEDHKLKAQVGGYTIRYSCGSLPIPRKARMFITEFDTRCDHVSKVESPECNNAYRRLCLRRDPGSKAQFAGVENSMVSVDCAKTILRYENREDEQCTENPARGNPHGPTHDSRTWSCTTTTTFELPIGRPPTATPVTIPTFKPLPTPETPAPRVLPSWALAQQASQ